MGWTQHRIVLSVTRALASSEREPIVPTAFGVRIPTAIGEFRVAGYQSRHGTEHIAFFIGTVRGKPDVLTRLHSACMTGDVLDSLRCDCGVQLKQATKWIADEGLGVLIYNPSHEGRGIGLLEKLRAYRLQDEGLDTVDANLALGHAPDSRDYTVEASILLDLGVKSVRLMTNNPHKVRRLEELGVEVSQRVAMQGGRNPHNRSYLETKTRKLGHWPDALG
jgi:GTP cyclohydrolase II